MMNEEELRQMMGALEAYRSQLESISEQGQIVKMSLEENVRARETLKKYKEAGEGSDILVPVGGDSFVYASVSSSEKVLVGLGAGITAEKTIDDALETIDKRVEELNKSAKDISEKKSQIEAEYAKLSQKVQEAYQQMQQ
jgi:prefoldin alpha subunit